ncbi:MAG: Holliday junction resolvase RuvX [Xanthomonadales bacterium]|nr:Holliday junction resolvase RuvX [Xanthomonadales bacterium]
MPEYVLGIDYGSRRIGIAIAQTLTRQASPLKVLLNNQQFWHELENIINEWQVKQLILGLPMDMDGEEQEITRQVKNFGNKLKQQFSLPINYVDERLSSFAAERQFQQQRAAGSSKAKDKRNIDAIAAQIILQSWLDYH